MSIGFFIVGFVIFATYISVMFLVVSQQHQKQRENPSNLDFRKTDTFDMDGMGNFSRFGPEKNKAVVIKKRNNKKV